MSDPYIVDVRRNSLDDGPGIRSVVFFKGCPLRCVWCQNPETLSPKPQIQREPERCTECGACLEACPEKVARPAGDREQVDKCQRCGACVDACLANGRRIAGKQWPVDELVKFLLRDEPFYRRSGGGVTFSGGEPAVNPRYSGAVAKELKARGVHVLLETSGQFAWKAFSKELLPHLSTIYFDLKIADDEAHLRSTGRSNTRIHENLCNLVESNSVEVLPRVPLVPGITDTSENLESIASTIADLGLERVALLSYNPLWLTKRKALGLTVDYSHDQWMPSEEVDRCRQIFLDSGLDVIG